MVEIRYQGLTLDGRYQLRHCLDKGSFGAVYEAVDLRFDSTVAVKILFEERSDTATAFRKEARLAREFRHPHVVTVFDYGTDAKLNVGYIVMEFLQGRRLDYVMSDRSSPVPDRVIAQFVDQIGWALQSAHERDLIHRDVKPRNVMLVDEGTSSERFVLLDLGLASKTNSKTILRNQTHDGALSPNYASPEQINQGMVDFRSDIYSFGTVLYQMVTGVIPFPRDNFLNTMTAICRDPVPRFAEAVPHRVVPADLQNVVNECLEKQPDARPPSIQEVRQRVLVALGFGSGYYSMPPQDSEGTIPKVLPPLSSSDSPSAISPQSHNGKSAAAVIPTEATNSIGMRFKLIPAGSFLMGSPQSEAGHWPDEGPQHRVEISRPLFAEFLRRLIF